MKRRGALEAITTAAARHPFLAILAILALTLPLVVSAGNIRPDNSLDVWFVEDDPALLTYRAFLDAFGNDESVVVAYPAGAAGWDAAEAALQARFVERLRGIDGLAAILSGAGLPAANVATLAAAGLASPDGRTLAVFAWMAADPDVDRIRGAVLDSVRAAADAVLGAAGREARLAGIGVVYEGLNRATLRDTAVFMAIALVLMLLVLRAMLRRLSSVLVAILPALLAAVAAAGWIAVTGRPMTMVMAALPTLVLVIALADGIHYVAHAEARWRNRDARSPATWREVVAQSAAVTAVPCLYTTITTSLAFLALATSRIAVVRDFGVTAAAGMVIAWLVTLALCTAGLALRRPPSRPMAPEQHGLAGGLARFVVLIARRRQRTLLTWGLVVVVLIVGMFRLAVDTLTIGMLPETHTVRTDSDWIESNLGYYTPLEFVVLAPSAESLAGEVGADVAAWRAASEQRDDVARTFGWPEAVAGGASASYLSPDGRSGRVTAFVPMMSARGFDETGSALLASAGELVRGAVVEPGGYLPLYVRIIDYVVQGTVLGLAAAFLLVFIVMGVLIRSWRETLAAVPANLFPVLLVFGLMGWMSIPLDIATATVGAIVLGIAVDDTIHFVTRFRRERKAGLDPLAAIGETARETGRALVFTTLVLAIGFGVMMASSLASVAAFGFVTMVAVLGALAADLALLPALLVPGEPNNSAD